MDYKLTDKFREKGDDDRFANIRLRRRKQRRITAKTTTLTDEYSYKRQRNEIYTFDYTIANEVSVRTTDEAERLLYRISAKTDAKGRITPKLRVTTTTTGHLAQARRPIRATPEGRLPAIHYSIPLQRPESIRRKTNSAVYTDGLLTLHWLRQLHEASYTRTTSPGSIRSADSGYPTVMPQRPEQPRFLHVIRGRSHLIRKHFQRYFSCCRLTETTAIACPK